MSTDTDPPAAPQAPEPGRRPRVMPWLIGIVALVVAAAVAFAVLDSRETVAPPTTGGQGTDTELAMAAPRGRCLAPDATTLAQAELAFEGSVVSVRDGVVTLKPTVWYAGDHADRVTVKQADPGMTDLIGAVDFRPGKDYLVAANGGNVMVCGFSGETTSDLTSLYGQAFPGVAS